MQEISGKRNRMKRKLNWGLLSTANIGKALLEPLRRSRRNSLAAVASRDASRAAEFARAHKIPRAYGSYEQLLADAQIDVIYNPLPNSLHTEWTIRALRAGKHVLCEKPLALSLAEVDAMAAAAAENDRLVVEALMYRSHAQTRKVREIVQDGQLGRIRLLRGTFTYSGTDDDNYRLKLEMGGGCLWDVGIYPLGYARYILGTEPLEVFGWQSLGLSGVDQSFIAQVRFPDDIHLQFDCSMVVPYHAFMEVVGEEAVLVIPQPFTPAEKNPLYLCRDGKNTPVPVKGTPTYVGEVEALADAILDGAPPAVSLQDSRLTIAAVQSLFESARTGRPVSL
jgi:D-xylose 1-dehydrogenase (NADP+, D-xylono-1,5-lactone-forming)